MRKINKGQALPEFTQYRKKYKPRDWDDFSKSCGTLKKEMTDYMLADEQCSQCGYTELFINSSTERHIDHFRITSHYSQYTFDWNNFVVAVDDEKFGAKYKDSKHGIRKGEYESILNLTVDDAAKFFEYSEFGEILAKHSATAIDKAKAENTREVFNLNHPGLVSRRLTLIKMIENYPDSPAEEIQDYLKNYGFKSVLDQYIEAR